MSPSRPQILRPFEVNSLFKYIFRPYLLFNVQKASSKTRLKVQINLAWYFFQPFSSYIWLRRDLTCQKSNPDRIKKNKGKPYTFLFNWHSCSLDSRMNWLISPILIGFFTPINSQPKHKQNCESPKYFPQDFLKLEAEVVTLKYLKSVNNSLIFNNEINVILPVYVRFMKLD